MTGTFSCGNWPRLLFQGRVLKAGALESCSNYGHWLSCIKGWLRQGLAPFVLSLCNLVTKLLHCWDINSSVWKVVCTEPHTGDVKSQSHHCLWTAQVPLTRVLVTTPATTTCPSTTAKHHGLSGLNKGHSFSHRPGGWKSEVRVPAWLGSGESSVPGFQMVTFPLCPPWQRVRASSQESLLQGLMSSFNVYYFHYACL